MILLHGDNQPASRNQLQLLTNQAREKNQEIVTLNGEKLIMELILQALETQSFFGQARLIVIENFFSRLRSAEKNNIINYLVKIFSQKELSWPQVIFWEPKEIKKTTIKKLDKYIDTKLFKIPALIFKFLDGFQPQNKTASLATLKLLTKERIEVIFYLLIRRISQLIITKSLGQKGLVGLAPWQQYKILGQAKKFSLDQLIMIYKNLLKIDIETKTGKNLMNLNWQLDLLIATF